MRVASFAVLLALCVLTSASATSRCPTSNLLQVKPRQPASEFTATAVINEKFEKVSLSGYRGKWVVLVFYPFDFTFVCPTELVAFSDRASEFEEINTQVVAISTDSHHTHLAWIRTPRVDGGLGSTNIPMVADISKEISRAYGVLVEDPEDDMYGAALRGLFVIDPNGVIRSIQINDDQVGRSVTETVRLIKAFQFAEEHKGEVCPAGWKPGSATIKATPDASKEYFKLMFDQDAE